MDVQRLREVYQEFYSAQTKTNKAEMTRFKNITHDWVRDNTEEALSEYKERITPDCFSRNKERYSQAKKEWNLMLEAKYAVEHLRKQTNKAGE